MMSSNETFFFDLPGFQSFFEFTDSAHYQPVPDDWLVVVADLENSTQAIERGLQRQVNSVSTALVISVLNVFDQVQIPFVFGGDGATICVPDSHREKLKQALAASRLLAREAYNLELRVGIIPVADLVA